jgi:hypothetical protein
MEQVAAGWRTGRSACRRVDVRSAAKDARGLCQPALNQPCASSTRWEASTHLHAGAAVGAMRTSASCQLFYPLPDDLQNEALMRSALGSEARLLYRLTQRISGVPVLRSPHSLALGKLGDGLFFLRLCAVMFGVSSLSHREPAAHSVQTGAVPQAASRLSLPASAAPVSPPSLSTSSQQPPME